MNRIPSYLRPLALVLALDAGFWAAGAAQAASQAAARPTPAAAAPLSQVASQPSANTLAAARLQAGTEPGSAPVRITGGGGGGISQERSFPRIEPAPWRGPRTPDGQPDVQGHWSNTVANHNNWTDPQGGIPGDPAARGRPQGPRDQRAVSRVSDPPDGQLPYQPWARAKQEEFLANFHNPTQPQYIEPLARCAPAGVPKSFTWHGYEIRQFPGYVLFLFNSGTRLVHLDGKPHLPAAIKLWNADSRGHWEGNTLVVDVTNNNGKALLGRTGDFVGPNAHITERYIFSADNARYNYVATVDDPETFTRPWTMTIPARRWTETDKPNGWHFETTLGKDGDGRTVIEREERICVENNGGFGNVATGGGGR
ncbi:hypothetical protein [Derxia gummosa]|uniref:Secreted protein n=1 Tax=Derxia gummosa DSM 723 TaxID=1121388 RepID=A0A8B6X8L5_9BURK|nr:hypothetical protein [Derxia gummosa]